MISWWTYAGFVIAAIGFLIALCASIILVTLVWRGASQHGLLVAANWAGLGYIIFVGTIAVVLLPGMARAVLEMARNLS